MPTTAAFIYLFIYLVNKICFFRTTSWSGILLKLLEKIFRVWGWVEEEKKKKREEGGGGFTDLPFRCGVC